VSIIVTDAKRKTAKAKLPLHGDIRTPIGAPTEVRIDRSQWMHDKIHFHPDAEMMFCSQATNAILGMKSQSDDLER
jgi:hypothetical protein